jgi:hypothetical protein
MNIGKWFADIAVNFGVGEAMEYIFPDLFDRVKKKDAKEGKSEGLKSNVGGLGINDEVIVLLGDYNTLPEAWKLSALEPKTIYMIAEGFKEELTPSHQKKMERICGLRENAASTKEYWLDRDGKKVDESAPPPSGGKGQPKGPQKVTKVVEKEMRNQDGKNILVLLFAIGSAQVGKKDPSDQSFTLQQKVVFKKAIASYLKNRGILRDFSDQAGEAFDEAEQTAYLLLQKLGVDKGGIEATKAHSENYLQEAKLRLERARAKR